MLSRLRAQNLEDAARRLIIGVRVWSAKLEARRVFRQARPPRKGCVCRVTGMAFPSAEKLQQHRRAFDFNQFAGQVSK